MRAIAAILALILSGCGDAQNVAKSIRSPDGAVQLNVSKTDLGGCCSNVLRASGTIFGEEVKDVLEIKGSSEVRYQWTGSDVLSIVACDGRQIAYRSSFSNADYSRYFTLSVENEAPLRVGGTVVCTSDKFKGMSLL